MNQRDRFRSSEFRQPGKDQLAFFSAGCRRHQAPIESGRFFRRQGIQPEQPDTSAQGKSAMSTVRCRGEDLGQVRRRHRFRPGAGRAHRRIAQLRGFTVQMRFHRGVGVVAAEPAENTEQGRARLIADGRVIQGTGEFGNQLGRDGLGNDVQHSVFGHGPLFGGAVQGIFDLQSFHFAGRGVAEQVVGGFYGQGAFLQLFAHLARDVLELAARQFAIESLVDGQCAFLQPGFPHHRDNSAFGLGTARFSGQGDQGIQ